MTTDGNQKPRAVDRVRRSYKKNRKQGRKIAGLACALFGGLFGCVYGIGSGVKEVITELLRADEDKEEKETPSAQPAERQHPTSLQ